ncbi:MAG: 50S ribosomal protein L21 [Phycisphaerales bacterium]|nr:50S ribosomal protein L21 [Phycisphaerales bacterium]
MYAIIEDSGTQIKLSKGDVIDIDLREAEDGAVLTLDKVLAIGDGNKAAKLGLPYIAGASVTVTVLGENDGDKIRTVKYKRRKGYRKTIGHRQSYLSVRVDAITG